MAAETGFISLHASINNMYTEASSQAFHIAFGSPGSSGIPRLVVIASG